MASDQTAADLANLAAGDRVEWGQEGATAVGILVRLSCDEADGPETCIHEDGSERPRFVSLSP